MKEVIEGLPSNKATAGEIPIKILKESGFTFEYWTSCVNEAILSSKFPDSLKLSNIVPVYNKKDPTTPFFFVKNQKFNRAENLQFVKQFAAANKRRKLNNPLQELAKTLFQHRKPKRNAHFWTCQFRSVH